MKLFRIRTNSNSWKFKGLYRAVLITGVNRRIGLAIAKSMATKNIKVLLGRRGKQVGVQESSKFNGNVTIVEINLSDKETLAKNIESILADNPQIDELVNNAGVLMEG